ncbi:MAG TPA: methyltransferase domain-containing protein, partial [Anaerolineales bacterium]|nr:methyltransferase domain-containing protein [Anaerolineales bacterium]
MDRSLLDLICCPVCHSALSLKTESEGEYFQCSTCERKYPIQNGIVHFIDLGELEGSNQKFARFYDRYASLYSLFSKFAFLPFGGERKARMEILDHLDLSGKRILEVSVGNGVNLPYLFDLLNPTDVFGIDISIGMLSQCAKSKNKQGWGVEIFLAAAEALPFRDGIFDNVLHIGGI